MDLLEIQIFLKECINAKHIQATLSKKDSESVEFVSVVIGYSLENRILNIKFENTQEIDLNIDKNIDVSYENGDEDCILVNNEKQVMRLESMNFKQRRI